MPTIYSMGQERGAWYLTTEWIDSPTLRGLFEQGAPNIGDKRGFIFGLLKLCLAALRPLHARGLLHGDITPGNILVDLQLTRLLLIDPAPPLGEIDAIAPGRRLILASPAFSAPEVLAGEPPTVRSDLFALGVVVSDAARLLGVELPDVVRDLMAPKPEGRPSSVEDAERQLAPSIFFRPAEASLPMDVPIPPSWADSTQTVAVSDIPDDRPRPSASLETPMLRPADAGSTPLAEDSAALPPAAWMEASVAIGVPVPRSAETSDAIPADFSVVAPPQIQPGRHFIVEVWVARSDQRAAMLEQATLRGRMVERRGRSHIDLARDTLINVSLNLPDFELSDPIATLGWNGDIRNVGFMVKVPSGLPAGVYPGSAKLMQGQIPFASIWFDLEVAPANGHAELPVSPLRARVQRIARAFASYASQDRAEVLRRVQGIQAAGTDVFMDVIALRAGEDWERTLYREINTCDGLFLFWSKHARDSPWVEREWRYALEQRGLAFINPLALEDPRLVQPPVELKSKHFNDMLLAFIASEEHLGSRT